MHESRVLAQGEFLQLERRGHWEYVRRVRSSGGAAFLVALTDADELVLVEQHRLPIQKNVVELPAGIIGDEHADEGALAAARRELLEETGFEAAEARMIFDAPTTAGITSEWAWFVHLRGLRRIHDGGGVGDEEIETHLVPLREANAFLAERRQAGCAIDVRIYAALYWLLNGGGDIAKP